MNPRDDAKAFVDGELDELRMEQVMNAMETDADLRGDIEAMRALGFELRRVSVDHEVKGVDLAISRFEGRRRFRRWGLAFSGMGLALLAMAIIYPSFAQSRSSESVATYDIGSVSNGVSPVEGVAPAEAGEGAGKHDSGISPDTLNPNAPNNSWFNGRDRKAKSENGSQSDMQAQRGGGGMTVESSGATNLRDTPPSNSVESLRPDLIRTATLAVKVKDAPFAMNEAMAIAKRMGGYHESSRSAKGEDQQAIADVAIRVPVSRFDTTLIALRKLGEVVEDTSDSQDVTAQIADVGARLKVLKAEEESYVTMLRAGRKVGEILEIKDRLSTVRQEIESLTAQQKSLKNQSSYSTISCSFMERPKVDQPKPPVGWRDDTWANAVNGLQSVGRFLGQAAIFLFVYSPIWLPWVVLGWYLSRRARRA